MPLLSRRFPRLGRERMSFPDRSALFHRSPSGYVVVSGQGVIVETNSTFAAWIGKSRSALSGSVFADFLSTEDLREYQRWRGRLTPGPAANLSVDFMGAGSTRLPAFISAVRTSFRGNPLDLVTVVPVPGRRRYERDLVDALQQAEAAEAARGATELRVRERESLLKTILDTVNVGVLVVDAEGREVLVNAYMEASLAALGAEDRRAVEAGTWPIYGPDGVTPVPDDMRPVRRAVSSGSFSQQILWVGAGQERIAVSVCARTVRDGGGFKGSVLAFNDVTQLVRALAAQGEFVGNVSHELRTPLTSILGYLDMALEEEQLPDTVGNALQAAVRNAERLLQLVSDLLAVASGSAVMELREVDVASVVAAAVDSFRPRARINGVEFEVQVPVDLHLVADAERIRQVLDNLVSNAVKYSPGGGTVRVQARRHDGSVVIDVADTGIGMTLQEQEQVFNKFFRAGQVLTAAIPGAGLGLAITRRIVEEHGGSIDFSSDAGRGTVFTVRLPAAGPGAGLQS